MKKTILQAKLETLQSRLTAPSRKVNEELARCQAGLEGEKDSTTISQKYMDRNGFCMTFGSHI